MSRTRGAARRDLLPVDPNRSRIRSPSAKGISLFLPAVALSGETSDFLFENFLGQQASHFCVMLNQMELRIDRAVEGLLKRLGSWRLFGVSAMLRSHGQSFFVGEWFYNCVHRGRTPFPYRVSTRPEYTPPLVTIRGSSDSRPHSSRSQCVVQPSGRYLVLHLDLPGCVRQVKVRVVLIDIGARPYERCCPIGARHDNVSSSR